MHYRESEELCLARSREHEADETAACLQREKAAENAAAKRRASNGRKVKSTSSRRSRRETVTSALLAIWHVFMLLANTVEKQNIQY